MGKNLRNVDLNLLKVFEAIMEERNISRAAERLFVSQPAISMALARLRTLYADELFLRTAKGVAPTPKAFEIAEPVHEAIRKISSTLNADEIFRPETSHRVFKVALTDYGEFYFLPHIMRELGRHAPDTDVVCLPDPGASLVFEMRSGIVDLVWDWMKIEDPNYVAEEVFRDKSYCITCKNHPKIKDDLTLELFLELEHVVLRPTRTHIPKIEQHLDRMGLERKVVAEVSHVLVIPAIATSTNLVGIIPERLARYFAKQLALDIYPNPVHDEYISVYQMWHRHFNKDAGHTWFRELLKSLAKKY